MVQTTNRTSRRPTTTHHAGARRRRILLYCSVVLAFLAIVIGALFVGRAIAHGEAFRNAGRMTTELANQVRPLIPEATNGDPERLAELDQAIQSRKRAGFLQQVTIWGADGLIIYADDPSQIGRRLDPPSEVTLAITKGTLSAEFEVQPEVSNVKYDENGPGFVEVYVPLDIPSGHRVAFEAYYDYSRSAADADQLFGQFLPLVLVLLVLMIIQLPIAVLVRKVRRHRAAQRGILDPTLSGTGKDRIQAAANLHDGPIQDIAGVGYALGALGLSVPAEGRPLMDQAQQSLQRAQRSLRRLMLDLYPLDLTAGRLPEAITSLAGPLRQHGIDVRTTFGPLPELTDDTAAAIYQGAHEALANVAEHAHASRVDVDLSATEEPFGGRGVVQLTVSDNGVGIDSARAGRPDDEHHGLPVLEYRLRELGGSLQVSTGSGGTTVRIAIPLSKG